MEQRVSLRLKPVTERLEARATKLKEVSRKSRNAAAYHLGVSAINGAGIAFDLANDHKVLLVVNSVITALSGALALHEALESSAHSQAAAAIEGALAQHELQAVGADPNHSYFVGEI